VAIDETELNAFPGPDRGQPRSGRALLLRPLGAAVRAQRPLPAAHGRAGNQAGEARTRELVGDGGFSRFRRAAETPFNLVDEARP
jgi:hypothetical protein